MNLEMFAVYDQKAQAFLQPFFHGNKPLAQRMFAECAQSPSHPFGKHPEDYTLFHLGTFEDQEASMKMLEPPVFVTSGIACSAKKEYEAVSTVIPGERKHAS